jgi:hypothetical protein
MDQVLTKKSDSPDWAGPWPEKTPANRKPMEFKSVSVLADKTVGTLGRVNFLSLTIVWLGRKKP